MKPTKFEVLRTSKVFRFAPLALGFALGGASPARAQDVLETGPRGELPDIEAIEKGQQPAASQSFRGLSGRIEAGRAEKAAGEEAVTPEKEVPGSVRRSSPAGGVYGLEGDEEGFEEAEAGPPVDVPEVHKVKDGDTLWTVCKHYYADPWKWPQLWAQNPHITNPHWIFPGDDVRLRAGGEAGPATLPGGDGPSLVSSPAGLAGGKSIALRELGFVEDSVLEAAGRISGSREEKIMLATGDSAYVAFPKNKPMSAGGRYTVFSIENKRPLRDPATRKVLGYLVQIHGDLVVDQIADESTGRGTLVDVVGPIERGFFVSQQVKQFQRVRPKPSDVSLETRVIAAFTPANLLAAESFVVLSAGSKDGVAVGNRSFIIRRGDGYRSVMEGWDTFDTSYPKEVVGELLVVEVKESTAVAWIARSTKEVRVGETTEIRKGY
jgi:hypothetical protein